MPCQRATFFRAVRQPESEQAAQRKEAGAAAAAAAAAEPKRITEVGFARHYPNNSQMNTEHVPGLLKRPGFGVFLCVTVVALNASSLQVSFIQVLRLDILYPSVNPWSQSVGVSRTSEMEWKRLTCWTLNLVKK